MVTLDDGVVEGGSWHERAMLSGGQEVQDVNANSSWHEHAMLGDVVEGNCVYPSIRNNCFLYTSVTKILRGTCILVDIHVDLCNVYGN